MDYSKLSDSTLKALKKGKPLDVSKLSDDEVRELSGAQKTPEPVSKTESFLRGAAQGGSLGFADEMTGGGEAALDKILGKNGDLADLYRQHRDESRANYKAAEEENPMTSLAGNLAGGLVTPIPFGEAKTMGEIALNGAKIGAAAGLGSGEADLTKGQIGKAGGEMLRGAGTGAAIGGVVGGLGKLGGVVAKSTPGRAFAEGMKGNDLVGKEARQKIGDELVQFAGKAGDDIQSELSGAAKNKMSILRDADASGQKLDISDLLNKIYPEEVNKLPDSFTAKGDAARASLNEPIERAKTLGKGIDIDQNKLMQEITGNPDLTHMDIPPQQPLEMTPTQIDSFRRALANLGFEQDLKDDQVVALAKRMSGKVGEQANEQIPGLGDANKKIKNLIGAQDIFNIGNGLDELGNQTKLTPLLQRLESDTLSSDVARSKFGKGIEALKSASPELGEKIEQQGTDLAEKYDLARDINKPISMTGNPLEMSKRLSGKVANVAGVGIGKLANTPIAQIAKTPFSAMPEYINALSAKLEAKGSKFAPMVKNLATESEPKRKAIIFSLMQQPAFRQAIESSDDENE